VQIKISEYIMNEGSTSMSTLCSEHFGSVSKQHFCGENCEVFENSPVAKETKDVILA